MAEDLTVFGERVVSEIDNLGREAELHPPTLRCTLIQFGNERPLYHLGTMSLVI